MNAVESLIEDDKGNVVGATTEAGDVKFPAPVKRSEWEKNPAGMVEARRGILESAKRPE